MPTSLAHAVVTAALLLAVIWLTERFGRLEGRPRSVRLAIQLLAVVAAVFVLNLLWPA